VQLKELEDLRQGRRLYTEYYHFIVAAGVESGLLSFSLFLLFSMPQKVNIEVI
jgi:hypothetical protein